MFKRCNTRLLRGVILDDLDANKSTCVLGYYSMEMERCVGVT